MHDLEKIDLVFCLNKPVLLMDTEVAASAVTKFFPTYIYPYNYGGFDN